MCFNHLTDSKENEVDGHRLGASNERRGSTEFALEDVFNMLIDSCCQSHHPSDPQPLLYPIRAPNSTFYLFYQFISWAGNYFAFIWLIVYQTVLAQSWSIYGSFCSIQRLMNPLSEFVGLTFGGSFLWLSTGLKKATRLEPSSMPKLQVVH